MIETILISIMILVSSFIALNILISSDDDLWAILFLTLFTALPIVGYLQWNERIDWGALKIPSIIYGGLATLYFFIKWVLECRRRGKLISESKYYAEKYTKTKDGVTSLIQPSFHFLFMHALLFPLSLLATCLDDILKPLYDWFSRVMQNTANRFLPAEMRQAPKEKV